MGSEMCIRDRKSILRSAVQKLVRKRKHPKKGVFFKSMLRVFKKKKRKKGLDEASKGA